MTSSTNIRIVALSVSVLLGGMFLLSLIAEILAPGSWSQQITTLAYAGTVIVTLPTAAIALVGFLRLAWRQAESSRFMLEVPTKNGPKYYARIPADQRETLLVLNEDEVRGVEVGSDRAKSPRVHRTPENRPIYVRASLPFPTTQRNDDLLEEYLRRLGGNGQ